MSTGAGRQWEAFSNPPLPSQDFAVEDYATLSSHSPGIETSPSSRFLPFPQEGPWQHPSRQLRRLSHSPSLSNYDRVSDSTPSDSGSRPQSTAPSSISWPRTSSSSREHELETRVQCLERENSNLKGRLESQSAALERICEALRHTSIPEFATNVDADTGVLQLLPPKVVPRPLSRAEPVNPDFTYSDASLFQVKYPNVRYPTQELWMAVEETYKNRVNPDRNRGRSKIGEERNVSCGYIENEQGVTIDGATAAEVRRTAKAIYNRIAKESEPPASWGQVDLDVQQLFYRSMYAAHPELLLCVHDWKVRYLATTTYFSWAAGYFKSKRKKMGKVKQEVVAESGEGSANLKRSPLSSPEKKRATTKRRRVYSPKKKPSAGKTSTGGDWESTTTSSRSRTSSTASQPLKVATEPPPPVPPVPITTSSQPAARKVKISIPNPLADMDDDPTLATPSPSSAPILVLASLTVESAASATPQALAPVAKTVSADCSSVLHATSIAIPHPDTTSPPHSLNVDPSPCPTANPSPPAPTTQPNIPSIHIQPSSSPPLAPAADSTTENPIPALHEAALALASLQAKITPTLQQAATAPPQAPPTASVKGERRDREKVITGSVTAQNLCATEWKTGPNAKGMTKQFEDYWNGLPSDKKAYWKKQEKLAKAARAAASAASIGEPVASGSGSGSGGGSSGMQNSAAA